MTTAIETAPKPLKTIAVGTRSTVTVTANPEWFPGEDCGEYRYLIHVIRDGEETDERYADTRAEALTEAREMAEAEGQELAEELEGAIDSVADQVRDEVPDSAEKAALEMALAVVRRGKADAQAMIDALAKAGLV